MSFERNLRGPRTPPPRRNISNTSDLSPSKWNALQRDSPLTTSPAKQINSDLAWKKSSSKRSPFPELAVHNTPEPQNENIGPMMIPTRDAGRLSISSSKTAGSCRQALQESSYNIHGNTQNMGSSIAESMHWSGSSLTNPFVRSCSNISRKRANAVLMDSPARRSHSRQMAKIFEAAKETVMLQDQMKERTFTRGTTLFSPPRRPRTAEEWHLVRKAATPGNGKPLPRAPLSGNLLPEFSPVGRLSDDIPSTLRMDSPQSKNVFAYSKDSATGMKDLTQGQEIHANEIYSQTQNEKVSRTTRLGSPRRNQIPVLVKPTAAPVKVSLVHSVAQWLDGIATPPLPWTDGATTVGKQITAPAMSPPKRATSGNHGFSTNENGATLNVARFMNTQHKLASDNCIQERSGGSCASSTKENDQAIKDQTADQRTSSSASASAKEREGWRRISSPVFSHGTLADDTELMMPLIPRPETPTGIKQPSSTEMEVAPLTPEVEVHRKGDGPRRKRCPSYYDRDILVYDQSRLS